MGIYLDCVFQPLLRETDFWEEAWRLEFQQAGNLQSALQYKGYVLSEMQKNHQMPEFIFLERAKARLFEGV